LTHEETFDTCLQRFCSRRSGGRNQRTGLPGRWPLKWWWWWWWKDIRSMKKLLSLVSRGSVPEHMEEETEDLANPGLLGR